MGLKVLLAVFLVVGLVSAVVVSWLFPDLLADVEFPVMQDGWWGRGDVSKLGAKELKDDERVKPFKVHVEAGVLQDLQRRLSTTRWFEPLDNVQFQYGFHQEQLKKVVDYWKTQYKWEKQERELNKFPQYTTQVEGIEVHFLHVKPNVEKKFRVVPLMLVHGWPGSVVEFYEILPLLTSPRQGADFVFEVICPSIPGYGFSEAPHQPGFSALDAARIFAKLMDRLGHKHYYVQGGDWGSLITSIMAMAYPDRINGLHVNMVGFRLGTVPMLKVLLSSLSPSLLLVPADQAKLFPLADKARFLLRETGYMHIQATKPDTVGASLSDSPAGLAAYLLEKFSTWTDPLSVDVTDGGLTKKFKMDTLLTNVMVYWVTNSITSSMRFYKENVANPQMMDLGRVPVKVPTAVACFPQELLCLPQTLLKHQLRNLVQYTDMPRGGHFAAMEEPHLLADDIWKFAGTVDALSRSRT